MTDTGSPTDIPTARIRIVFLAWGFSIHAKRRISVFAEDPRFGVTIISPYPYQIPGAAIIPLTPRKKFSTTNDSDNIRGFFHGSRFSETIWSPFILLVKFFLEIDYHIRDLLILKKALSDNRPDIIFLQTLLYPCYLVELTRETAPVIITFWNGDLTWWARWTGIERLLKKQIISNGVRRAAAVTVNSNQAYDACLQLGKPAEQVHIIRYPGIDMELFRPIDKGLAKNAIEVTADRIILWPRGTGEYLNFDTFVAAAAILLEKYPDIRFVVLFPNKKIDGAIRKDLAERGLERFFTLVDRVEFETMPYYYSAADAMVSISSNDSLPNTMLEAMACGCPVIMGDIPQIRDWITDSENGYLCPVDNAFLLSERIRKVIENADGLNERFIAANLDLVWKEFDSRLMRDRIKELVEKVAAGSKEGKTV